jgi:hypothetical protein
MAASALLAGALVSPASAQVAAKGKSVNFKGHYKGTASLLISGSTLKVLSLSGTGPSSTIGATTLSGKANGTSANGLCVPFKGKGTLKGATGTVSFAVDATKSQGCSSGQSGPVTVTVTGTATVKSGTGSAAGAQGTLAFKGTMKLKDTSGSQSGTFSGTLSGKLTIGK